MAVTFNGTSDMYATAGNPAVLDIANNAQMSISFWLNLATLSPGGAVTILGKGFDGTNTAYSFQTDNLPSLSFGSFVSPASPHNALWNPLTFSAGTWVNVYGDYTAAGGSPASTWRLYVANSLVASTFDTVGPISTVRHFTIGGVDANGTAAQFISACIADVAVYAGPLTGADVTNLANGTIRPNGIVSQTLLGYWKLDTGGATQTDFSGNGNSLTNNTSTPGTCGTSPPYNVGGTFVLMGQICA